MNSAPASVASEAPEGDVVEVPKTTLEGDALIQALKSQLEFYFSKQNLEKDMYLRSQMDSQKFVSVDVIAGFRKVKSLTEDRTLLLKVMRKCKTLKVADDGKMVRPNKVERNTIILRDIPSLTPESDIRKIFDHTDAPGKVVTIKKELEDTWFVTFASEDIAMDTCLFLSSQTFNGKPIRCRIKSETLLRGGYGGPSPAPSPVAAQIPWSPNGVPGGYTYGYPGGYGAMYPPTAYGYGGYNGGGYKGGMGGGGVRGGGRQDGRGNHKLSDSRGEKPKGKHGRDRGDSPRNDKEGKGKGKNSQSPSNRNSKGGKDSKSEAKGKKKANAPAPALGAADFPALPTARAPPAVSSGYEGTFAKYSIDQMAKIVRKLAGTGFAKPQIEAPTIMRDSSAWDSQLLEPMPVMYPASPSPLLAAQPHHSSDILPFLDLNMPFLPPDVPRGTTIASDTSQSKSSKFNKQWKGSGKSTSSQFADAGKNGGKDKRAKAAPGKAGSKDSRKDGKGKNAQAKGKGNTRQTGRKDNMAIEAEEKASVPAPSLPMGAYAKLAAAAPSAEAVAQAKKIALENKLRAQAKAGKEVQGGDRDESTPKKSDKKDGGRGKGGRRGNEERRRGGNGEDNRRNGQGKKDNRASAAEASASEPSKAIPTSVPGKMSYAEMARKAAERAARKPVPPSPSRGDGRRTRENSSTD